MSSKKKPLEELAEIFANNHKHNSEFTTGKEDRTDFTRIVLIIGAGASHSANGEYFLLGDEAANRLENKFHKSIWTDGALENKKRLIRQQQLIQKAKKDTFEERLSRLSYFVTEAKVQSELKSLFGVKPYPNLSYELIAHLFKNRFIDVIIDFNFDETLDLVLKEEMKSAQWVRILTDGDVKDYKDILVAGKLNSPVYIKSHGSISHKSTMRFTKDQYLSIPEDVSNIMFSLFTDQLKPKEQLELQEEAAKLKNEIREYKDRKKSRLPNMTYNDKCYLDPRENRITEIAEEVKSLELIDGQLRIPSFTSLNFITLGFELESIELNNLIEKAIKLNKSIDSTIKTNLFNFDFKPEDYKPEYSEVRRKTLSERTRITEKNIRLIDMKGLPRIQDYQTILTDDTTQWMCENAISSLEKEVSKKISDLGPDFKYNTAGSHYHRYIFMKQWERENRPKVNESGKVDEGGKVNPTPNEKNSFNTPNYFKARFMYECCLEVIKSKGCFDLEDALSLRQRVGYYYDCYYHSIPYVERDSLLKSPTELLKSLGFVNLNHIIPGVMLNQDGDFWGIMTYMNSYEPPTLKKLLSRWQEDLKQTTCEDELAQWVVDFFVTPLKTDYLDKMFISDPCKIYPNFDDGPLYFFKDIKKEDLLFSETLFEGLIKKPYTYLNIESHKLWNRAIIIQDYGISFKGTICSFIDSLKSSPHTIPPSFMPIKICLIVSNIRYGRYSAKVMRSHLEKKSTSFNLNIQIDIHYLPPNLHNHHLHVYYKLEESKSPALTYIQSCYYYKRTTRNEMNGVYFEDSGSKFNHDGILRSGFRALSRSMWIASVIHENRETISIDMVTDTTDKLHDLYLEFKKNVSAFNNLTRNNFESFDKYSKQVYIKHYRNAKTKIKSQKHFDLIKTSDYVPDKGID